MVRKITGKVEPVAKKWLSKTEAMAYLGVSEDYLMTLRNAAEISFSQRERMIWYGSNDIERFFNKKQSSIMLTPKQSPFA